MIPEIHDGTMVQVCGPVASGKTWLAREWALRKPRVLIFDPTGEYADEAFEQFWSNPRALATRLEKADRESNWRIVYHPSGSGLETGFEWATHAFWQLTVPRWYFIEEVHEVMSPNRIHPQMQDIVKYSRKRGMGVVGITQRIADLHKGFTANSRQSVLFHTSEPRDIDTIADRYGIDAAATVESLRPLGYDEITRKVSAIPEALLHVRGKGYARITIDSNKGEPQWQSVSNNSRNISPELSEEERAEATREAAEANETES